MVTTDYGYSIDNGKTWITQRNGNLWIGKTTDGGKTWVTLRRHVYPPPSNLYDDFEGQLYSLGYGQVSPNGKWKETYAQSASVKVDPQTGNNAMVMTTGIAIKPSETYSSLLLSTQKFKDFDLSIDVKTLKQSRTGSIPNNWEVAWLMWNRFDRYDDFHYYAFLMFSNARKNNPTGFQLEKKDNDIQDDAAEIFLVPPKGLGTPLKINTWQNWRVRQTGTITGTPNIQIWVDGIQLIDYTDNKPGVPRNSPTMLKGGSIVLYCEDSTVAYDNVRIEELKHERII